MKYTPENCAAIEAERNDLLKERDALRLDRDRLARMYRTMLNDNVELFADKIRLETKIETIQSAAMKVLDAPRPGVDTTGFWQGRKDGAAEILKGIRAAMLAAAPSSPSLGKDKG